MADVVICTKCGAQNAPDDQFCGSCGAFLEWQRRDATAGAQPGLSGTAVAPEVGKPAEAVTPRPDSAPAGTAPSSTKPVGDTVVCRVCQTVNAAGRSFCQRCGSVLEAPAKPAATAPVSAAPAPVGRGDSGRRLPIWMPILGLGALVALVAVGAALLNPGTGPAALATNDPPSPSPTLLPTEAPAASASPASPLPTEAPTPTPTTPPPVQLTLTGAKASSVIGNREKFSPDKAIDGRLDTSWQEGAREERGQWIEVTFEPATVDSIVIHAGYQLRREAYLANRRPREILVSIDGGAPARFELADVEAPQPLDLDGPAGSRRVRIEIVSTYDPQATTYPGSPFDDMAISEIVVLGFPGA